MRKLAAGIFLNILMVCTLNALAATPNNYSTPTLHHSNPSKMTANEVLESLKRGNLRFISEMQKDQELISHLKKSQYKQHPMAVILSCMDSRVSPELIFDQGIGDIFVLRIAGNIADNNILGSLEFATKVAGAKLIVVMGHTNCGAVRGACEGVKLGHLTSLLSQITPAVKVTEQEVKLANCKSHKLVNAIAKRNVQMVVNQIQLQSPIIGDLIKHNKVKAIGAMFNLSSGKVTFLNDSSITMKALSQHKHKAKPVSEKKHSEHSRPLR